PSGGNQLAKRGAAGFRGAGERLVQPAKRLRQGLPQLAATLLRAHSDALGDRLHDFPHAMAVEAAVFEREQRHVVDPGADVDTLTNRLTRGLFDALAGQFLSGVSLRALLRVVFGHGVYRPVDAILFPVAILAARNGDT